MVPTRPSRYRRSRLITTSRSGSIGQIGASCTDHTVCALLRGPARDGDLSTDKYQTPIDHKGAGAEQFLAIGDIPRRWRPIETDLPAISGDPPGSFQRRAIETRSFANTRSLSESYRQLGGKRRYRPIRYRPDLVGESPTGCRHKPREIIGAAAACFAERIGKCDRSLKRDRKFAP